MRIGYHELVAMGATEKQLEIYSNSDPLKIEEVEDGLYNISGIVDAEGVDAKWVLGLLDDLGVEEDD